MGVYSLTFLLKCVIEVRTSDSLCSFLCRLVGYLVALYFHMTWDPGDVAGDTTVRHCEEVVSHLNDQVLPWLR